MPPTSTVADLAALGRVWSEHEAKMRRFIDSLHERDVTRVFEYRLMNGQPGASTFGQMLQHLANHGSYHRGQVTTMLRQLGAAPPKSMDLIAFYRERVSV